MNRKLTTIRLAYDAVLAAMCAVLGSIAALDLGNLKFTFENFPVLVGALLFGPVDGMLIGGIGIFLSQMIRYGIELSTPLWVLPYIISGLFTGFCAKRLRFSLSQVQMIIIIVINGIIVTAANTLGLFIYNKYILQVPLAATIAAITKRVIISVIKSVVFAFILPPVLRALRNVAGVISHR